MPYTVKARPVDPDTLVACSCVLFTHLNWKRSVVNQELYPVLQDNRNNSTGTKADLYIETPSAYCSATYKYRYLLMSDTV